MFGLPPREKVNNGPWKDEKTLAMIALLKGLEIDMTTNRSYGLSFPGLGFPDP